MALDINGEKLGMDEGVYGKSLWDRIGTSPLFNPTQPLKPNQHLQSGMIALCQYPSRTIEDICSHLCQDHDIAFLGTYGFPTIEIDLVQTLYEERPDNSMQSYADFLTKRIPSECLNTTAPRSGVVNALRVLKYMHDHKLAQVEWSALSSVVADPEWIRYDLYRNSRDVSLTEVMPHWNAFLDFLELQMKIGTRLDEYVKLKGPITKEWRTSNFKSQCSIANEMYEFLLSKNSMFIIKFTPLAE